MKYLEKLKMDTEMGIEEFDLLEVTDNDEQFVDQIETRLMHRIDQFLFFPLMESIAGLKRWQDSI